MKMHNSKNDLNNLTEEERFDLLSAYIDNEVTSVERQQVQYLLDRDPEFKKLYAQLNALSSGIQNVPIPVSQTSHRELSQQVFQKIDRQSHFKRISILTGGAIASMFVGAGFSFLTGFNSAKLEMATTQSIKGSEPLMIAINEPLVQIPQTPGISEQ